MKIRRFSILIFFFPLAVFAQPLWENMYTPKDAEIPAFRNVQHVVSDADCQVRVDMADILNPRVSNFIYGNNSTFYHQTLTGDAQDPEHTFFQHARDLSPNILRWPGGNGSNEYFWDGNIPAYVKDVLGYTPKHGGDDYWGTSLNEYYRILEYTNSTGIICVNTGYARYGWDDDPVATAAGYAADWVRDDNGRTRYWELGNENYGSWTRGYNILTEYNQDGQAAQINGDLYGRHARVFIDSMRKAADDIGHEIEIGIVLKSNEGYTTVMAEWNDGVVGQVGDLADFSVIHSYYTPHAENSSASVILNSYALTADFLSYVDASFNAIGLAPLPYALTEYNIKAEGSSQRISQINALHAVLVLGEMAAHEDYVIANRWDLANGYNSGDDHGMFTKDHPGIENNVPYADFFHMYFFQRFFGDKLVNNSVTGSSEVVVKSSVFSSGEAGVVLINKGQNGKVIELDFENFPMNGRYYWYLVEGDEEGSFPLRIRINGESAPADRFGPENYTEIMAQSAMHENGKLRFYLPAYSAAYLLAEENSAPSVTWASAGREQGRLGISFSTDMQEPTHVDGFYVRMGEEQIDTITQFEWDAARPDSLVLVLNKELGSDDAIYLDYMGTSLLTAEGTTLPAFEGLGVDYEQGPELLSAKQKAYGYGIELICSENMYDAGSALESFSLRQGEMNLTLDSLDISGPVLSLFLFELPEPDTDLYLSYSGNSLVDARAWALASFEDLLIENTMSYTTHPVPGKIEAEDLMAESGIRLESCMEGGLNILTVEEDSWLEFDLDVQQSGHYVFSYRYGKKYEEGMFTTYSSLSDEALGTLDPPWTFHGQYWATVTDTLLLDSGPQRLRMIFKGSDMTLNWIDTEFMLLESSTASSLSRVRIYPNPARGHVIIEAAEVLEEIRIVDLAGRVLLDQRVADSRLVLDLDLEAGLYQLILSSGGRVEHRSLVITD